MRTIHKYLPVLFSIIAMTFGSCSADYLDESDFPMEPGVGDTPLLNFDGQDNLTVSNDGGEYSFSFTANLPWMVESRASWVTLTCDDRGEGGKEPVKVTFTVSRNGTIEPRSGEIRVWITEESEHIVTIYQEATPIQELGNNWYVKADGTGDGSSWASPTTLSNALAAAVDNDKIYVAAGTHCPTGMLAGGNQVKDNTFHVAANVSIIGGFPADATEGAVADPDANPTILSGDIEGGPAFHVMVVTAPKSDIFSVNVSGVTITGGYANSSAQTITINGAKLHRSYGAGITVGNTNVAFTDCVIRDNYSPGYCGAVYVTGGGEARFTDCLFEENESGGNGACIWNSATLYMDGCTVRNNSSTGVGCGLYAYDNDKGEVKSYIYNTSFLNNRTDGTKNSRRGGGCYFRENSRSVAVNCTFDGNFGGNGAAVALYGTSALPSELTMISCTVTNNESAFTGGGVEAGDYTTLNMYNSIVAGNRDAEGYPDIVITSSNAGTSDLPAVLSYCIDGSAVYGKDKAAVSGAVFDFETMLSSISDGVRALSGDNNPALSYGMPVDELASIVTGMSPEVDPEILVSDQKGNDRTGNVMGAYTGD